MFLTETASSDAAFALVGKITYITCFIFVCAGFGRYVSIEVSIADRAVIPRIVYRVVNKHELLTCAAGWCGFPVAVTCGQFRSVQPEPTFRLRGRRFAVQILRAQPEVRQFIFFREACIQRIDGRNNAHLGSPRNEDYFLW